jgi:hypothetical protein
MGEFVSLLFILILFIIVIVVMRLVGAWMLRIDEVIKNQKLILEEMRKANRSNGVE